MKRRTNHQVWIILGMVLFAAIFFIIMAKELGSEEENLRQFHQRQADKAQDEAEGWKRIVEKP